MKKLGLALLCSTLLALLLSASLINAHAMKSGTPTVSPLSGDKTFTFRVITLDLLPGTQNLSNGMLVPIGFPAGEKQFDGEGIVVESLDYGSATACFPINGTRFGWGGQIGRWNGSHWVLLPTSITRQDESLAATACATITSNGTYALIRWIVDRLAINAPASGGTLTPTFVSSATAERTPEMTATNDTEQPTNPAQEPTNILTDEPTPGNTETPSFEVTSTPGDTETPTPTDTDTPTATNTHTSTPMDTDTPTATNTSTPTPTDTNTPTATNTNTPTPTDTDTPTATNTNTPTPTDTDTPTATNTHTPTPTDTDTPTATNTHTPTPTDTDTPTATNTYTPTPTDTDTPTPTNTHTPTPTDTDTPTPTTTNTFTPTPTGTATQSAFSMTFAPAADAYVRQASPNTNFGSNVQLWVQTVTGASYQSYLKFTVSGVTGTVRKATLRVFATSACVDGPAVALSKTNWTETGVKWNNRPDLLGGSIADQGAMAQDTWVEFDVTSLVSGNGTYSFALVAANAYASSFSSREGSQPAQLIIEVQP